MSIVPLVVVLMRKLLHEAPIMLDVGVSIHSLAAAQTTTHQLLGTTTVAAPAIPIVMAAAQMVSALPRDQAQRVGCPVML